MRRGLLVVWESLRALRGRAGDQGKSWEYWGEEGGVDQQVFESLQIISNNKSVAVSNYISHYIHLSVMFIILYCVSVSDSYQNHRAVIAIIKKISIYDSTYKIPSLVIAVMKTTLSDLMKLIIHTKYDSVHLYNRMHWKML